MGANQQSDFKAKAVQGGNAVTAAASDYSGTARPTTLHVMSISATNRNAAARYVWVSATAVAGDPIYRGMLFLIPAGGSVLVGSDMLGLGGINMQGTNFTVAVSTSSTAFAAGTAGEHDITVYFRE